MQQQQNLMHMNQGMMGGYTSPATVTTDIIQQYLDENKQLILAILDNQNNGKVEESERNQAKLQHNLMYLAAIADSQPPQTAPLPQYPPNMMMQPGARYMSPQAAQMMSPQQLMAARSSMMYGHPSMSPLQQQHHHHQQQQASAHGQLGMAPGGGTSSGFNILHGEASGGGAGNSMVTTATGMFSGFGRGGSGGGAKEGSTSLSVDLRGGGGPNSSAQSGDGEYMKAGGTEEEGS